MFLSQTSLIYYNMYKVIVGFNLLSLTITAEFTIKPMGCNIIMNPLKCGNTMYVSLEHILYVVKY